MKTSLGEKVFWTVIALSSIGAAAFGYHRFKLIRPDLYAQPPLTGVSEEERAARIAEYQQEGDALTRAAVEPSRRPRAGESCQDGFVVAFQRTKKEGDFLLPVRVVENGRPVRCEKTPLPPSP